MKKETRFSVKCERFIKLIIQLLPLFVFVGYLIYPFLCALGDANLNLSADDNSVVAFFNNWYFSYYSNGLFDGFFESINSELIPSMLFSFVEDIESFFAINGGSIIDFVIFYIVYLIFVEILWLLKNVLMFLPKIGNYFISKWSGD